MGVLDADEAPLTARLKNAFGTLSIGLLLTAFNVRMLNAPTEDGYYPVMLLLGVPMLLSGAVGLVFSKALWCLVPYDEGLFEGSLGDGLETDPLGTTVILIATGVGLAIGAYLIFRPDSLVRWLGL